MARSLASVTAWLVMALLLGTASSAVASDPYLGLTWTKSTSNPVLAPGPAGAWDSLLVVGGPVVLKDGVYHTWYTGSSGNSPSSTGHATSQDGVHWTKDAQNPVLSFTGGASVLLEGGLFKMWYTNVSQVPWTVDYATSPDGSAWTVVAHGVLTVTPGAWDGYVLATGPVYHNATGYAMWYSATATGMEWSAGLATSPDGIHWTKYPGNPILSPGFAGSFTSFRVHPSSVLYTGSEFLLWFVGSDSYVQRIGTAVSADGIRWTPSFNVTVDVGPSGAWDSVSLSRASVLQTGSELWMWYTGNNGSSWQVGLATATAPSPPAQPSPPSGFFVTAVGEGVLVGLFVLPAAAGIAVAAYWTRRRSS